VNGTLRLGIVGCGGIVRSIHADAFAAQPGIELAGWTNRTRARAEELAHRYGGEVYATTADLIERAGVDLLLVATAEWAHLDAIELGLDAGLHLFVEKPLYAERGQEAVTENDYGRAREVLEKWDRAKSIFGVNFNYRSLPHALLVKADVDAGTLGEIALVHAWSHVACWSHTIDLLLWLFGDVESVDAVRGREATACTMRFRTGVVAALTRAGGPALRERLLRIEVHGSEGSAEIAGVNGTYRRDAAGELGEARTSGRSRIDVIGDDYARSHLSSIAAYCSALVAGVEPPVTGDDGLAELKIEAAIDRSANTGKRVALDDL
jgi:myo-inositol 2-dehydrogenase / D-chiro-inositol 1-dehydrogenase